jgi:glucose-6-phosphate dehydrogenase assembly protein OpcA
MEAAVSLPEASRLERFEKGDRFAVSPEAIERELASLWREAGESQGGRQPVTRACLWNLVVHLEERKGFDGEGHAARLSDTLKELPRYLASRTLIVRTEDRASAPELECWISANCAVSPEGGKVVCSEEITIAAGARGEQHIPALVRALQVPDVPTAAVFAGVPVPDRSMIAGLIGASDRLIVRADASSDGPQVALGRLASLCQSTPLGAMDLGWVLQSDLRFLIAELFEPPVPPDATQKITEVVVTCRPDSLASGRIALGWIASVLGAKKPAPAESNAWRLSRQEGDLTLRLAEDASSPLAISSVALIGGGQTASVHMASPGVAELAPQVGPRRQAQVEKIERASALSTALRTRHHDAVFERALSIAIRL